MMRLKDQRWTAVDDYLGDVLVPDDEVLTAALEATAAAGLPAIQITAPQGMLLHLLARMQGARRILEIGTLGGYSTIWLARGLAEGGRLITLEISEAHAEVARRSIARAGLAAAVDVRVGPALETLRRMTAAGDEAFDLVFVDANKEDYPEYFQRALDLSRRGTVIVFDNVIREGKVVDPKTDDPAVQAMRHLYERLAAEKRVSATAIQTVGSKGYDGFAIALVTSTP